MDEYDRKAQLERDLQEYDFDVKAWDKDSATGKVWGVQMPRLWNRMHWMV